MSLDRQAVFNKAVAGLAAQNFELSVKDGESVCLYRGPHGRKCAVGHLIDDVVFREELNTAQATHPGVLEMLRLSGVVVSGDITERAFFRELQRCHDLSAGSADMRRRLRGFARQQKVQMPAELLA